MENGKLRKKGKCVQVFTCLFSLIYCFSFFIILTTCGRRADPVLVPSYDEKTLSDDKSKDSDEHEEKDIEAEETPPVKEAPVTEVTEFARPDTPTNLAAVFTGKSIVLTWKEVLKQGVKMYNIYRSSGEDYLFIGHTVTPAFTDRDIKRDRKYYYKVTAVGQSESLPSEEILVLTELE